MVKTEKFINSSMLECARRWLEYIPKEWKLDEVYKKTGYDLTTHELEILLQIKREKTLMSYYHRMYELLAIYGSNVYMSLEDAEKLDALVSYVETKEYECKISTEVKEYVDMLLSEVDYDNADEEAILSRAISGIQDERIKEYVSSEWKTRLAERIAKRSTEIAKNASRRKKPHSVFPRTPNRIK